MKTEPPWNRCDVCGRFISFDDFCEGGATRTLVNPDAYGCEEIWETLCKKHALAAGPEGFPEPPPNLVGPKG